MLLDFNGLIHQALDVYLAGYLFNLRKAIPEPSNYPICTNWLSAPLGQGCFFLVFWRGPETETNFQPIHGHRGDQVTESGRACA